MRCRSPFSGVNARFVSFMHYMSHLTQVNAKYSYARYALTSMQVRRNDMFIGGDRVNPNSGVWTDKVKRRVACPTDASLAECVRDRVGPVEAARTSPSVPRAGGGSCSASSSVGTGSRLPHRALEAARRRLSKPRGFHISAVVFCFSFPKTLKSALPPK